MTVTLALDDEAATEALGRRLADAARPGDVIALAGPLGSGKTVLARAFIRHLTSAAEDVPSPTFTLAQLYRSRKGAIWHFDLFRLTRPEEAVELGMEDAFAAAITLIEWPERLGASLPTERLDVRIEVAEGSDARRAALAGAAWGDRLPAIAVS
jgi:tRNA threonylcarbamoyladenosine biosynthesis protein TsaE